MFEQGGQQGGGPVRRPGGGGPPRPGGRACRRVVPRGGARARCKLAHLDGSGRIGRAGRVGVHGRGRRRRGRRRRGRRQCVRRRWPAGRPPPRPPVHRSAAAATRISARLCMGSPVGRPFVRASRRPELHDPSEAVLQLAQRWPFRYLGLYWKGYTRTSDPHTRWADARSIGSRSRALGRPSRSPARRRVHLPVRAEPCRTHVPDRRSADGWCPRSVSPRNAHRPHPFPTALNPVLAHRAEPRLLDAQIPSRCVTAAVFRTSGGMA